MRSRALLALALAALVAVGSSGRPPFSPQLQAALDSLAAASSGADALNATRAVHAAVVAQSSQVYGWIEAVSAANVTRFAVRVRALPSTTDPHPIISTLSNNLYTDLDAWLTDAYDYLNFAFAAVWSRLDEVFTRGVSIPYAAWGETDALDASLYPVVDGINDRAYSYLDVEVGKLYVEVDAVNAAEWASFEGRVNTSSSFITSALSTLDSFVRGSTDSIVTRCSTAAAAAVNSSAPLSSLYDALAVEYTAVDTSASAVYERMNADFLAMYPDWGSRWHELYTFADDNHLQQPFYDLVDSRSELSYRETDRLNDDLYGLADARVESCYVALDQASAALDSRWMSVSAPAHTASAPVTVSTPVVVAATLALSSVSGTGVPAAVVVCDQTHTGASVTVTFDSTGDSCSATCGTPVVCARPAGMDTTDETPVTVTISSSGVGEDRVAPRDGKGTTSGHRQRTPNVVRVSTYATSSGDTPSSLLFEASGGNSRSSLNGGAHLRPTVFASAITLVVAAIALFL